MSNINENLNRTAGEIAQAVEPERHPLRWLWWLLGAAIIGSLIWTVARACTRAPEPLVEVPPISIPTTLPADAPVLYSDLSANQDLWPAWRTNLEDFDSELADSIDDTHLGTGFRHLCAAYLNGDTSTSADVAEFFGLATVDDAAATHLTAMVDNSWCVRP